MKLLFFLFCFALVFGQVDVRGQVDRSKKPTPGPTPPLGLPNIQRAVLKNGLKVMLVEYHQVPMVQFNLVLATGTTADPDGKPGTANLTTRMIDEGTEKRTALQVADELDFIGASISASTTYDGSFVNLQTLKEHVSTALDICSDVLLHATFPQKEFDRIKKDALTSLIQQKDQPVIIANKIFASKLYGDGHPYGRPSDGNEASVNKITIDDLKAFYGAYFEPNNATLIVVGDVSLSELVPMLERTLGLWKSKPAVETPLPQPSGEGKAAIYLIDKPQAAQSQIRVGQVGLSRNTVDYFPVTVMNTILGGGFSSRLNWNLREQKGYTYGTGSGFQFRKGAGPFSTSGGFRTNVTDSSVMETLKEIKRLRDEEVSETDLRFAKDFLTRSVARAFETPGQIAGQLANLVLYGLPDNYFDTYIQNIEKVTADDVKRVAEKHLKPENMLIVAVGDVASIRSGLGKIGHGSVLVCDSEGKVVN
ncbi:MAG TPA: pitrilysin family protein [Bacteroidota bacterium]|nr:pitrilysin family protein [Bacteroidota bacterium]